MLTIEEKIRQLEAIAESGDKLYADYEEHGLQDTHGARRAKSLIEEKRQEIAWLREFVELKKYELTQGCYGCKHNPFKEKHRCRSCKRMCLDKYEPERRTDADD